MCMQDIQIAQQTVYKERHEVSGGNSATFALPQDFRRYSINVTVGQDAPGPILSYPQIRVYIGSDSSGPKIVSQMLFEPFLISLRDWGSLLLGPLFVALDGNGSDSVIVTTELSMIRPPNPNTLIAETK